jgi:transmembrane sensor
MLETFTDSEQIASEESFIAWYTGSDAVKAAEWEAWMSANEGQKDLVTQAMALLGALRLREQNISDKELDIAQERALSFLDQAPQPVSGKITRLAGRYRWLVAASVVLVLFSAYLIFNNGKTNTQKISSEYGQIKEQRLPDGTEVVINANSDITYSNLTRENRDREVWLKGEAFFHVSKTAHKRRFIVHTDHFDIIVTGTQFNVVNRAGVSNVMLREGSVTIETAEGKEIKMVPGDYVEFSNDETQRKQIKSDSLVAWKDKKLVFDNTSLTQVIKIIHEHYGIEVKLSSDTLGDKTISGMLPNDNLDILLQAINATNDLEVVHKNNEIIIQSRQ